MSSISIFTAQAKQFMLGVVYSEQPGRFDVENRSGLRRVEGRSSGQ
jgi:hypothetical protein